jgi:hypothetical protein
VFLVSTALDDFGKFLMARVRDEAITQWDKIAAGEMKGRTAERLRPAFERLGEAERELVNELIPRVVDTTLHQLLWAIEQTPRITLAIESDGATVNLARVSDGLPGDLVGWISGFSRERHEK